MPRTTAFGWYDGQVFGAVERVQKHVAFPDADRRSSASGGSRPGRPFWRRDRKKRPLVFGGNDIPGVMMAGAMRTYLNRHAVAPGHKTAIFTTNDSGYALATDLEKAGTEVVVVDSRRDAAIEFKEERAACAGGFVANVSGGKRVEAVEIWRDGQTERIAVDSVAMSGVSLP